MPKLVNKKFVALISFWLLITTIHGQTYTLEQTAIAAGGGTSTGGFFAINGTTGQPVAGTASAGGAYDVGGGFWGSGSITAASGIVSGRVTTPTGAGLKNAVVSITDSLGGRRTATTSSFGFYSFDNVSFGRQYTLAVASRRYRFAPQFLQINGPLTGLDFVGLE
ncbi:hypothetical protein BH10ACI2_BH10ACI2_24810 [soil metagenome]